MIIWKLTAGNQLGQETAQQKLEAGMLYIEKLKKDNEVTVENKGTHLEIKTNAKSNNATTESV